MAGRFVSRPAMKPDPAGLNPAVAKDRQMFRRFFVFYTKVYFKLQGLKTGLLFRKLVSEANRWRKSNPAEGRSFRKQIMSSERAKNKTKDAVNYGGRKISFSV